MKSNKVGPLFRYILDELVSLLSRVEFIQHFEPLAEVYKEIPEHAHTVGKGEPNFVLSAADVPAFYRSLIVAVGENEDMV